MAIDICWSDGRSQRCIQLMLFTSNPEFPEFLDEGKVFLLDQVDDDDERLAKRGRELLSKDYIEVSHFKIKQKEDYYGLYVR